MRHRLQYIKDKIKDEWLYRRGQAHFNRSFTTMSDPAFFIISAGRSGSTLLRKLLMNGKQVHIPPESDDNIPKVIKFYINNYQNLSWQEMVTESLEVFQGSNCFKFWNIDLLQNVHSLVEANEEKRTIYQILNYVYNEHKNVYNPQATVIGDKTPYLNLQLKWIVLPFRDAKFIHLVRDGRDVVASRVKNFNETINEASNRWITSLDLVNKYLYRHTQHLLEVKYEDLVCSPSKAMKLICDFLKIEYSVEMTENNEDFALEEEALVHHKNLKRKVTIDRVGRWVDDFSGSDRNRINRVLRKYLNQYKYQ